MTKEESNITLVNMRWDMLMLHLLILAAEEKGYQGLTSITPSTLEETCGKSYRTFRAPMMRHWHTLLEDGCETTTVGIFTLHASIKGKNGSIRIGLLDPEQQAAFDSLVSFIQRRKNWFAHTAFMISQRCYLRYTTASKGIRPDLEVMSKDACLFDVILESSPPEDGDLIKRLRCILNLRLKDLLRTLHGLPRAILQQIPLSRACRVKRSLEFCGALVSIQQSSTHNYPGLPKREPEYFTITIDTSGLNRQDIYRIIRTLTPSSPQEGLSIINSSPTPSLVNVPWSTLQKEEAFLEEYRPYLTIIPSVNNDERTPRK